MSDKSIARRLSFERLESRQVLSLSFGLASVPPDDFGLLEGADAKGGAGGRAGPQIDLPTVVAHELGHSLGLPHSTDAACGTANQPIMCPYYIGPAFRLGVEDVHKIRTLYPDNEIVANAGDARWDNPNITFSFMPDGTSIDQGGRKGSALFTVMKNAVGPDWQSIFRQALNLWAEATDAGNVPDTDSKDNALQFTELGDNGSPFNFLGNGTGQGDAGVGDIRFGSHKFDGAGGVLAHAYFPPPNGASAAGDAHFAMEENWKNLSGLSLSPSTATIVGGGNLTSAPGHSGYSAGAVAHGYADLQSASDLVVTRLTILQLRTLTTDLPTGDADDRSEDLQARHATDTVARPWLEEHQRLVESNSTQACDTAIPATRDTSVRDEMLKALDEILLGWPKTEL